MPDGSSGEVGITAAMQNSWPLLLDHAKNTLGANKHLAGVKPDLISVTALIKSAQSIIFTFGIERRTPRSCMWKLML